MVSERVIILDTQKDLQGTHTAHISSNPHRRIYKGYTQPKSFAPATCSFSFFRIPNFVSVFFYFLGPTMAVVWGEGAGMDDKQTGL